MLKIFQVIYKKKFYRWATVEFLTLVKQICLFNYKNELTTICELANPRRYYKTKLTKKASNCNKMRLLLFIVLNFPYTNYITLHK